MDRLLHFRKILVIDFEFKQLPGHRPIPHCCVIHDLVTGKTIRWIGPCSSETPAGKSPISTDEETLVITYFGAAETLCLLALGWPLPRYHIDLYAEFRCYTNGRQVVNGNGLLSALSWFGLDAMAASEKDGMRDLAIRGGPFSQEEQEALLEYCEKDVKATADLARVLIPKINLDQALLRGRYMLTVGQMEFNGIPVDASMLENVREHWPTIRSKIIETIDASYGVYEDGTFRAARWGKWTEAQGIHWPRHPNGLPKLDQDTFKEMAATYPQVAAMKELRQTLAQLRAFELPVGPDGRNRSMLSPFSSKTGRNQPSTTKFIFGLAKWMRGFIRPREGRALGYFDYEQQEFGIAAALSRDRNMLAAYRSGDPYLSFAKQAQAVPADATKLSHPNERNLFKSCALGVQYGMGVESLAARTKLSYAHAKQLYELHRSTYPRYWEWSEGVHNYAVLEGKLTAAFGWTVKVEGEVNGRFLRNYPLQANGAEMLRIACIMAAQEGVNLCAPIHDALLIEADEREIDEHVARCEAAMQEASRAVLPGFELRVEHQIIRHPDRFPVGKGRQIWDEVVGLLDQIEAT